LPYRIALNKLKAGSHPVCEPLSSATINSIVSTLFPTDVNETESVCGNPQDWDEEFVVRQTKVKMALSKVKGNKKAPGLGGVFGGVLTGVFGEFWEIWASCFTTCLRTSVFPKSWKESKLVLLKKKVGNPDDPGIYRPICPLNEIGKLFEKIIVRRLNEHVEMSGGLSEHQFGFREGRSTLDAIDSVKEIVRIEREKGRVIIAISLDIKGGIHSRFLF